MYWGDYSGDFSYQSLNGYSEGEAGIREAASEVAAQPFLIQWGLDAVTDGGNNALVPYELLMSESEQNSIGTMFWEWRDPDDNSPNSLVYESLDPSTLTDLGQVVINTHPASIKNTAHPVEDFPTPLVEFPSERAPSTAVPDDNEPGDAGRGLRLHALSAAGHGTRRARRRHRPLRPRSIRAYSRRPERGGRATYLQEGDTVFLIVEDDPSYAGIVADGAAATRASRCWLLHGAGEGAGSVGVQADPRSRSTSSCPTILGWTVLSTSSRTRSCAAFRCRC